MTNRYVYVPDLVADMAECDANYLRLRQLFPNMDGEDDIRFGIKGQMEDGATVTIVVTERFRFTTMLSVKVESDEDKPWIRWPSLSLRMYHDVRSAEVVQFERHGNFRSRYPTPNKHMFAPDEKSQINKFLGELLAFCIEHGHSLAPVEFH